ncbi:MAG: hypothetical protein JRN62_01060 [Nitrososphaerota archaeon]|nr:hypothetical protein [Nitrososphaerota archaeon]
MKQATIERAGLPNDSVVTLTKSTIEDYMLCPAAFARAFPTIKSAEVQELLAADTRRNKKDVLDRILKGLDIGKYDREKAGRIADAMEPSEIDEEIRDLISRMMRIGAKT